MKDRNTENDQSARATSRPRKDARRSRGQQTMRSTQHLMWGLGLLLAACSGGTDLGPSLGGDGTRPPTTPPIQDATCSTDAGGATGFVTCHELERLGALALVALRLSSLGFSMSYERAVDRVSAGASPCPMAGMVSARLLTGGAVQTTLMGCDFGVGAITGTVRTLQPMSATSSTDWAVDVSWGSVRYQGTGSVDALSDSIPQVALAGSLTVGDATPLNMDMYSIPIEEADGSITYGVGSQYFIAGGANAVNFQASSPNFDKTTLSEKGGGFVVVELPFTRTIRYRRTFSDPPALRFEAAQADLDVEGRALDGTLFNTSTGQGQPVATTWDAAMAAPRYDFAD